MIDDPLDQLRRQLVVAGDRRAEADGATGEPPASGRRRARGRRRGLWLTLAALLVVAPTVAAATGIVALGQSAETEGRKIARQAARDTAGLPACGPADRTSRPVLSDAAPLPAITAALPSLGAALPRREQARVLAALPGYAGTVLRRTLRTIGFPGGVRLTVFVQIGVAFRELRDPTGCGQARRERATALSAGRGDDVKRWAQRRLAELRDTATRSQTLWVRAQVRGQSSSGGAAIPVRPGQRLRPGLLSAGSGGRNRSVYVGLASPRAGAVRLDATRGGRVSGLPARVAVRQGLWAVVLAGGTGPIKVREVTAQGTVLRVSTLRG